MLEYTQPPGRKPERGQQLDMKTLAERIDDPPIQVLAESIADTLAQTQSPDALRDCAIGLLTAHVRPQTTAWVTAHLRTQGGIQTLSSLVANRLANDKIPQPGPIADWLIVAAQWGDCQPCPPALALRTIVGLLEPYAQPAR